MKLKAASIALAICALISLLGCAANGGGDAATETDPSSSTPAASESETTQLPEKAAGSSNAAEEAPSAAEEPQDIATEGRAMNVKATLNGQDFDIELADNDTARAFAEMLPLSGTLSELNGNEKYLMVDETLPSNPSNPGTIEAGDVMLYQDDCIVVFYETHSTSYSYTRIGKVTDTTGLAAAVGSGSVEAVFAAS